MTTQQSNTGLFDSLGILDMGLINPIIHSPITKIFKNASNNTTSLHDTVNKHNSNSSINSSSSINNNNNNDMVNYYRLSKFNEKYTDNCVSGYVTNHNSSETREQDIFMKYSPLIDPIKYLNGSIKYDPELLTNRNSSNDYLSAFMDNNKCAFVDGFFSYLSSKLLNEYGFINGVDFYGSFLAQKNKFNVDITDDIDCLCDYSFFGKNENTLYTLQKKINISSDETTSSKMKRPLTIENDDDLELDDVVVLQDDEYSGGGGGLNVTNEDTIATDNCDLSEIKIKNDELSNIDSNASSRSLSVCSSKSSNSTDTESDHDEHNSDGSLNNELDLDDCDETHSQDSKGSQSSWGTCSDSSYDSNFSEDEIIASINIFPVQVIAMEKCKGTLDSLITHKLINAEDEWSSIVIQILFSLITFKRAFEMTHNDLHSNNIMYTTTSEPFIYYMLNDVIYKVPTFGKIFKIIDFGRSIYSFRGKSLCSDCFSLEGDATTQYNFKPYFNENKPIINPNFSFDLCRLGCALYDVIIDDNTEISKIMLEWVLDDKGRNVLYKKDGSERYPDFKLYKMIARTVHNHIPMDVLNNKHFGKYIISKKSFNDIKGKLINIDAIPSLS